MARRKKTVDKAHEAGLVAVENALAAIVEQVNAEYVARNLRLIDRYIEG
jgi:uncharacterized protein YkvS